MILPDVNLLLYAYHHQYPQHAASREWWEVLLNGEKAVGIPWSVILSFARILTNEKIFAEPTPMAQVARIARSWLSRPQVRIIQPTPTHLDLMEELVEAAGQAGNLIMDIHLAALAIQYDAEVHTNDRDFTHFPGVRHHNPLTG